MMSEPTDSAVNRAAISSIMMPTGILVFRPVKAAIQPLAEKKRKNENRQSVHTHHCYTLPLNTKY